MSPIASPNVLILEDNPDDEALLRRALQEIDPVANVIVARDGVEAIEAMRNAGNRVPDMVLVDLKMPRMTGFEFLRVVRADPQFRTLPLIVFTSSNEARDVERAYEAGATAYVQKPLSYETFTVALRVIFQFWLRINEPARKPAQRLQRLL